MSRIWWILASKMGNLYLLNGYIDFYEIWLVWCGANPLMMPYLEGGHYWLDATNPNGHTFSLLHFQCTSHYSEYHGSDIGLCLHFCPKPVILWAQLPWALRCTGSKLHFPLQRIPWLRRWPVSSLLPQAHHPLEPTSMGSVVCGVRVTRGGLAPVHNCLQF